MHTRTPSIRTLAALAYERGEEFDPALMLSPALAEQLDGSTATATGTTDYASYFSSSEKWRIRRESGRSGTPVEAAAPSWFEASDLAPCPLDTRHGELLAELAR